MEREVCHVLYTNEDSDCFYHIMVKSPKSWCSTSVIELLEHTLGLCLNHFSIGNITGFNTILTVSRIVHRSLEICKYVWSNDVLNDSCVNQKMGSDDFVITVSVKDAAISPG